MFWEVNAEVPSIRIGDPLNDDNLRPFERRLLVVELQSTFTGDRSKVDVANRVFLEDPTMREFLSSPEAGAAYIQDHMLPFTQKYTVEDCVALLTNPPESVKQATNEFVKKMARGGIGPQPGEDGQAIVAISAAKQLLLNVHEMVKTFGFMKNYLFRTLKIIPGLGRDQGTAQKPSKLDNMRNASALYPFLFKYDETRNGFQRLSLNVAKFNELVQQHGVHNIGLIEQFPNVFDLRDMLKDLQAEIDDAAWSADCPVSTQMSDDVECEMMTEAVDLVSLQAYADLGTDRQQTLLDRYIRKIQLHGFEDDAFPGLRCLKVRYIQKYNIAGRKYATGLSLQNLTKEARAAACQ
jgi:hypothetical protein